MDQAQTADLLTMAGEITGHRLRPEQVVVWQRALAQVPLDDAVSALIEHFADPVAGTEYLKPAHITRVLAARRLAASLLPPADVMCGIHDGYPLERGRCDQCTRYPGDRTLGVRPPTRNLSELALTVGRTIPEEA
ncbi:hypothetical protein E3O55_08365 [Cryobacterium sp. MDB1-18-2]|uniref:hypothetical protein n=1 Tax=unclassified Cryobacterium TaxID=2649013 RepID=UPI00106976E1|nr:MULTISPECIES: hypothetical protein [unclassified Cryobacterium]TFC30090.1 hypothetical protein E3O55_08365 [Cryobacterium sp. MDB1-18-2]TFC41370.1 hypothetical protein E3O50_09805 [Cryobacterium sp. MDB1-18-1]